MKTKNANLNFVRLKKIDKKPNTNAPESMTNDRSNCRNTFVNHQQHDQNVQNTIKCVCYSQVLEK